jgi:hypothetical protein
VATANPNNPPLALEPVLQEGGNFFSFAWYRWFTQTVGKLLQTASATAPATSAGAGSPGQISYDGNYLYVCIQANVWKRVALTAF